MTHRAGYIRVDVSVKYQGRNIKQTNTKKSPLENVIIHNHLIPHALQSGVPSSASLHIGVFLVQHDAHTLLSDTGDSSHSVNSNLIGITFQLQYLHQARALT